MREACGCLLVKTVELAGGKTIMYPYLMYCCLSIESSIQNLSQEPDFLVKCEQWRTRQSDGLYTDVYDGRVWKDFQSFEGKPFLSQPHNFGLAMNFDFFQPYKHVSYSVGHYTSQC